MDQQAARGDSAQQQRQQAAWSEWRRPAVTAAILVGLCAGLLAMPTPEELSGIGQCVLAVAAVAIRL